MHQKLVKNSNIIAFFLLLSIFIGFFCYSIATYSDYLRGHLYSKLIYHEDSLSKEFNTKRSFIYILGGSRPSLELKFKEAVRLYNDGFSDQIFILNSQRLTVYNNILKRNLTDNEWAVRELTKHGISQQHINFIDISNYKFGTYSEAKTLKKLVNAGEFDHIFLVCSRYHSARVKMTFSEVLKNNRVTHNVYNVDEPVLLRHLIVEFLKYNFYRYILLPTNEYLKTLLF